MKIRLIVMELGKFNSGCPSTPVRKQTCRLAGVIDELYA